MLEQEILAGLENGDEKVLDELFARYYVKLTHFAMRQINDPMMAEDIVQDVYIYMWNKRSAIKIEKSLEAYLYRAVANRCINHVKSKINRINRITAGEDEGYNIGVGMVHVEVQELEQLVELTLKSLPEQTALIYAFSRNAGLTHAEIADKLGISRKTIEYHIGSALKQLRKVVQNSGYVIPGVYLP